MPRICTRKRNWEAGTPNYYNSTNLDHYLQQQKKKTQENKNISKENKTSPNLAIGRQIRAIWLLIAKSVNHRLSQQTKKRIKGKKLKSSNEIAKVNLIQRPHAIS